jgi:hypothetical protein
MLPEGHFDVTARADLLHFREERMGVNSRRTGALFS